jgi:hypothetical protein
VSVNEERSCQEEKGKYTRNKRRCAHRRLCCEVDGGNELESSRLRVFFFPRGPPLCSNINVSPKDLQRLPPQSRHPTSAAITTWGWGGVGGGVGGGLALAGQEERWDRAT